MHVITRRRHTQLIHIQNCKHYLKKKLFHSPMIKVTWTRINTCVKLHRGYCHASVSNIFYHFNAPVTLTLAKVTETGMKVWSSMEVIVVQSTKDLLYSLWEIANINVFDTTKQTLSLSTQTSFLTSVGLSSLLFVLVCPRLRVDCWHVIVCVLSECPRMTASERALNWLDQDSAP